MSVPNSRWREEADPGWRNKRPEDQRWSGGGRGAEERPRAQHYEQHGGYEGRGERYERRGEGGYMRG